MMEVCSTSAIAKVNIQHVALDCDNNKSLLFEINEFLSVLYNVYWVEKPSILVEFIYIPIWVIMISITRYVCCHLRDNQRIIR